MLFLADLLHQPSTELILTYDRQQLQQVGHRLENEVKLGTASDKKVALLPR